MKKFLLFTCFSFSVLALSAQCPFTFKSQNGGGNCPNIPGEAKTAKITLEFGVIPGCLPDIIMVRDKQGVTFAGTISDGVVVNGKVEYCVYGAEPKQNFFNQPDLILTLDYSDCPGSETGIYNCDPNSEIPLPVHFKTFNANRTTSSSVAITWTTATEQNNKGFNVQKNVGGEWKTIAFVPTQAKDGSSSYDLNYSYKDVNNEKGITQYRIQQVDLDGKFAFTDIRAIRGESTASKLVVYPNPSVDGKLNVVFEDNTALRDVYVSDMQGKIIRSYRNISNNLLVIEKLTSGFYTIKVFNRNTSSTSVEKAVIK